MSRYSEAATHSITHHAPCADGRSEVQSVTLCVTALVGQPRSLPPSQRRARSQRQQQIYPPSDRLLGERNTAEIWFTCADY